MKKRTNTLRNRVFVALICIVIIQCLVFTSIILLTGTLQSLDESSNTIFENTVHKNAETLENYMIEWAKLDEYADAIEQEVNELSQKKNQTISQYMSSESSRKELLNNSSEIVLTYLRTFGTTGCFIILDDGEVGTSKDAVALRDLDPQNNSVNNYDILVEAGYNSWMADQGLTLDTCWSEKLPITQESDFYYKPLNAGNDYQDAEAKDLGYYSQLFRLHEDDIKVITYTRPLLDENHNSYGVIGVDITESYVQQILAKMGVGITEVGNYYIGLTQDGEHYQTVLVKNGQYQSWFKSQDTITMDEGSRFMLVQSKDDDIRLAMCLYECKLYNTNTPFENDQWVIGGFVDASILTEASNKLLVKMIIAIVVSFVVCLVGAILLANGINRPIKILLSGVEKQSKSGVTLPRTGMKEIDNLALQIEKRTNEVYEAGSKVADIIEIANINLGILEYVYNSDEVFCTRKVMEMFDLPLVDWKNNYISKVKNQKILEDILNKLQKEESDDAGNNIYWYRKQDGEKYWVRLEEISDENCRLCVFIDATDDMKEKMQIAHERDFDVLTNLYNRRAFARIVKKIMKSGNCKQGVLTIWDLDHLKYVNDTYGHEMGDKYISGLADVLSKGPAKNYIAARMAGDEFITFVYNRPVNELYDIMRNLHEEFSEKKLYAPDGQELFMSVSAGMAAYPNDVANYKKLKEYADFAMYQVKKSQKGQIKIFDENDKF